MGASIEGQDKGNLQWKQGAGSSCKADAGGEHPALAAGAGGDGIQVPPHAAVPARAYSSLSRSVPSVHKLSKGGLHAPSLNTVWLTLRKLH